MTDYEKYDLSYTQNRELSWLDFNKRVLLEANEPDVPILEKLKFISIFNSNLDEFFMVRVGSLSDLEIIKDIGRDNKSGMTVSQQLDAIFEKLPQDYELKDQLFTDVEEVLRLEGISRLQKTELSEKDIKVLDNYFEKYIAPIISPMILDDRHPFPFLANKQTVVVGEMIDENKEKVLALVGLPSSLKSIIPVSTSDKSLTYVLPEDLIQWKLEDIFSYSLVNSAKVSVTRNADIDLEEKLDEELDKEYEEDFRKKVKKALKKRARLQAVRLEIQGQLAKSNLDFFLDKLGLEEKQVFYSKSPLNIGFAYDIEDHISEDLAKSLSYESFEPVYPSYIDPSRSMIEQIKEKDILLYFPFESMNPYLELLKEASNDPKVVSIKITIYRLSSMSKVAEYLANAAENGKEVIALMELRARFDEDNNINWSERLESSGVTVIYGMEGFKVHSKVCLITRTDQGRIEFISQFGTGNYNEKTAKQYTDLSLMTSDEDLGRDAQDFFSNMLRSNLNGSYKELLVAPHTLKPGLMALIDEEIHKAKNQEDARIIIKCNSITERSIIDKLAEASQAGVKIYINVRGICCILPGIKGKTDNIHITSIVGRYLEHPRVYIFGKSDQAKIFISSADLMTRNLVRRVEIACPIYDPNSREKVLKIIETIFDDDKKARKLLADGSYVREKSDGRLSSQDEFISIANQDKEKIKNDNFKKKTQEPSKDLGPVSYTQGSRRQNEEDLLDQAISKMSFLEKLKKLFFN